jgi:hypothetical protein
VLFCPHVQIIPSRSFLMGKFRSEGRRPISGAATGSLIFPSAMDRIEA